MERFGRFFKWITFIYLMLVLVIILAYGFFVKGGSWGSLSDVVIAVFTVLIAYTTNMLLVAAWLTSNSWLDEKKFSSSLSLLKDISGYYHITFELRKCQVKAFDLYEQIRDGETYDEAHASQLAESNQLPPEKSLTEICRIKSSHELKRSDLEGIISRRDELERERVDRKIKILIGASLVLWGDRAIKMTSKMEGLTVDFYDSIFSDYESLSKEVMRGERLKLPEVQDHALFSKYKGQYTFEEIYNTD
jgi:hypothetical protein